jgi:copper chaperone NosL
MTLRTGVARRAASLVALVALAAVALAACAAPGPRPVALGEEECGYCRMTVTDARFAAEARTARGRVHVFDSIECLAGYANATPAGERRALWVTDYDHPGTFLAADSAAFWRVGGVGSPMGKGLLATAGAPPAGVATPGTPLRWRDVLALMAREGMTQAAAAGGGHGHAD